MGFLCELYINYRIIGVFLGFFIFGLIFSIIDYILLNKYYISKESISLVNIITFDLSWLLVSESTLQFHVIFSNILYFTLLMISSVLIVHLLPTKRSVITIK